MKNSIGCTWLQRRKLWIGATKTKKWLVIQTSVDTNEYAKGTKITDKEIQSLAIERDAFHGEWNYTISPR
jgi:hypothetical protein